MSRRRDPSAIYGETDLKEYARRAIAGDNPIKMARVLQIAAAGAEDYDLFQKLVTLVDRLIVCDDEYMSTIDAWSAPLSKADFYGKWDRYTDHGCTFARSSLIWNSWTPIETDQPHARTCYGAWLFK
jgi:hypothetical protein